MSVNVPPLVITTCVSGILGWLIKLLLDMLKDYIESIFPGLPFKTSISRTIKVQEAFGRSLYKPFSTNKAVKEYEAFTEEVMERIKNKDNE